MQSDRQGFALMVWADWIAGLSLSPSEVGMRGRERDRASIKGEKQHSELTTAQDRPAWVVEAVAPVSYRAGE